MAKTRSCGSLEQTTSGYSLRTGNEMEGWKINDVGDGYKLLYNGTTSSRKGELDDYITSIPQDEILLLAVLNSHVGEKRNGAGKCHGNHGYDTCNEEGGRILEFATAYNLALVNMYYIKKHEHLITYSSGDRLIQIDYWAMRYNNLRNIMDCKVIPAERQREQPMTNNKARMKWWKLGNSLAKETLVSTLPLPAV
ncbi:unnamed protein product [Strongylus vulgaris]|uniref:Uncharacterized protein n=1 Tax=Strongylus vulgaris TaxID=40348 RepID=A0A3P7JBW3_STRVU|nr:unnamed protein product [Strongylus vulgaris]